ncbi:hypothetical protein F4818DRAFT_416483 [Hypoxylon cercidicola]|nr:hypothetical protein F4818DRAFT_416483 [Hypoxylon cercidicola]
MRRPGQMLYLLGNISISYAYRAAWCAVHPVRSGIYRRCRPRSAVVIAFLSRSQPIKQCHHYLVSRVHLKAAYMGGRYATVLMAMSESRKDTVSDCNGRGRCIQYLE